MKLPSPTTIPIVLRRRLSGVLFCVSLWGGACRPDPTTPEAGQAAPSTKTGGPPAAAVTLPPIPDHSDCVIRGPVSHPDVTWKLRTRLDAVPSMVVRDGRVTGWLRNIRPRDHNGVPQTGAVAVAEVENQSMTIRALVASEDLNAVLTAPFVVAKSAIPDGQTDRRIEMIEGRTALLDLRVVGGPSVAEEIACDRLGLQRKDLGTGTLLPPSEGTTLVRRTASLSTGATERPVSGFNFPTNDAYPAGVPGLLLGDDHDRKRRLISFRTCGGIVFGTVPKSALVGAPSIGHGSNARCPDTGDVYVVPDRVPATPLTCSKEIPVFMRTATLEDPIGFLKLGARLGIDGPAVGDTELISVPDSPAEPLGSAHFSARVSDLASCSPAIRSPVAGADR